jgi:hypothetical protein
MYTLQFSYFHWWYSHSRVKALYSWKPISRRPKICWVDDVRKDIQKLKVPNWKTLAQDRR